MRSIRVAIPLTLILLGFIGFIACSGEPDPGGNKNGLSDAASSTALAPSAECQGTHAEKLTKLRAKYEDPTTDTGDADLNDQRIRNLVRILIEDDQVLGIGMRIKGSISGKGNPRKLSKFIKFFEKDLEKGCIQRVSFESMTASSLGFEWTICNDPERPCPPPDGECGMCAMNTANVQPTPPVNANSNTPSNPNSGTKNTNSSNSSNTNSNGAKSGP